MQFAVSSNCSGGAGKDAVVYFIVCNLREIMQIQQGTMKNHIVATFSKVTIIDYISRPRMLNGL